MNKIGNEFQSYYGNLDPAIKPKHGVHIYMMDEHIKQTIQKEIIKSTTEFFNKTSKLEIELREISKLTKPLKYFIEASKSFSLFLEEAQKTKSKAANKKGKIVSQKTKEIEEDEDDEFDNL